MRNRVGFATFALLGFASIVRTAPPGGIEITCDVSRKEFRTAAVGQTEVKFKLHSLASGGSQLGFDYTVPIANLNVSKRYTESMNPVKSRRNTRISAVIGSDGSPALLPVDGQAWLEVMMVPQRSAAITRPRTT